MIYRTENVQVEDFRYSDGFAVVSDTFNDGWIMPRVILQVQFT